MMLRPCSSPCIVILFICAFSFTRDHNENKAIAICLMPLFKIYHLYVLCSILCRVKVEQALRLNLIFYHFDCPECVI